MDLSNETGSRCTDACLLPLTDEQTGSHRLSVKFSVRGKQPTVDELLLYSSSLREPRGRRSNVFFFDVTDERETAEEAAAETQRDVVETFNIIFYLT